MPIDELLQKAAADLDAIIDLNLMRHNKIEGAHHELLADLKIAIRDLRLALLTEEKVPERMSQLESALSKVKKEVMIYDDKIAFKLSLVEKSLADIQQQQPLVLLQAWQDKFGEFTKTSSEYLALSDTMRLAFKATGIVNRVMAALQADNKSVVASELRNLNKVLDNLGSMNEHLKSYPESKLLNELRETVKSDQFSTLATTHRAGSTVALYKQLHEQSERTPLDDPALLDSKSIPLPKLNVVDPARADTRHLQQAAEKVEKQQDKNREQVTPEIINIKLVK